MKVIFLDFDGVLNSERTHMAYGMYGPKFNRPGYSYNPGLIDEPLLDEVAVGLLRRLIEDTDTKIVISSSWREHYTLEAFKGMFEHYYKWQNAPIIDFTSIYPSLTGQNFRGNEITEWLDEHPEVTNFIVLDDNPVRLPKPNNKKFIQTCKDNGFQLKHFQKAKSILGNEN